jgi:hypothetical protein
VDSAVLALLFFTDAFELKEILAFFLIKHVQLFFDALLFVFEHLHFELVNFLLLIFVDIQEFTFLQVILGALVLKGQRNAGFAKRVGHKRTLFVGLGLFLHLFDLFLFDMNIAQTGVQL